ncbi:glycine--tRNA ligase subunit beta [Granulicatella seriolae]|uniref:Glycine--tRNA ligase beta subunit n=1 Tax=Granulicatella seriolae TaxID=2967226 RepID=A0ABT1WKY5_9LACT|nr:glycine--tRNA ligase subunit beta [Granulicatella seriolae]
MTKPLLLEIGLEELPARYVRTSADQLGKRIDDFLTEANISHGQVDVFATPRRLCARVADVAERQEDRLEIFKGPSKEVAQKDGDWTKAAQGFVRGKGLTVEDIYFEEVNGIEYVHVKKEEKGLATIDVLKGLSQVITSMTFGVTMRWNAHNLEYIRPIHWLVALYGSDIIPEVHVLNIQADRISQGHRFLGKPVSIEHADDYEAALESVFVIADQDKRKEEIRNQLTKKAQENNWVIPVDEDLLEEVSAILEYPTVFSASFDEKYLSVPDPVLVTSMREHQRYFVVYNHDSQLLPFFISARNGNDKAIENVAKGNQKVLTARLEDALFFYHEDQKESLSYYLKKLDKLNFHAKIGSISEKMARVQTLIARLAKELSIDEHTLVVAQRAAEIYKFDLVTNMVGEFPELQGVMGEIYAIEQGESKEVAQAIREHYLPTSFDGQLPESTAGALLAIADKLDSFLSFISVGLIPTGSNDPYALRRQLMGVVQIAIAFNWELSLDKFMRLLIGTDYKDMAKDNQETVAETVSQFLKDRIAQRLFLITKRHDVIEAILESSNQSIPQLMVFASLLDRKHDLESFKETTEALTRVINLSLKNSTKEELDAIDALPVDEALLENDSERKLVHTFKGLAKSYDNMSLEEKFNALEELSPQIKDFFETTMVMAEDPKVRENRLNLLKQLAKMMLVVANFSSLNVK